MGWSSLPKRSEEGAAGAGPERVRYRAYGADVEVVAEAPGLWRAFLDWLGPGVAEGEPWDPALVFRVREAPAPGGPPPGARQEYGGGPFQCWTRGAEVILRSVKTGSQAAMDADGTATLEYTPQAREDLADQVVLYSGALMELLRRQGGFFVHAAGLRPPSTPAGALIVGSGGSGKSTLTAVLAREGLLYLSDDGVVVRRGEEGLSALSEPRAFGLDAACADWFPDWAGVREAPPDEADPTKRRVRAEALFPGQFVRRCEPRLLLFPRVVSTPSALEPMRPREALVVLLQESFHLTVHPETARRQVATLAALAEQCRAFALASGGDLVQFAPKLAAFIREEVAAHD